MPKQKTHKGLKKRFKITASGKPKHKKAFRGHKHSHKSAKRKRQLRADGYITNLDVKNIIDAMRPSL